MSPSVHTGHDSTTKDAPEVEEEEKKEAAKAIMGQDIKPVPQLGLTQESLAASNRTLSMSQGSLLSIPDHDSSATLSADEGPPSSSSHINGPDNRPTGDDRKMEAVTSVNMPGTLSNAACYTGPPGGSRPKGHQLLSLPISSSAIVAPSGGGSITAGTALPRRHPQEAELERETKSAASGGLGGNITINNRPEKRASPACVRDLIDCAIERNIAQDLSQKSKYGPHARLGTNIIALHHCQLKLHHIKVS